MQCYGIGPATNMEPTALTSSRRPRATLAAAALVAGFAATVGQASQPSTPFDLVLSGGRVMDPASGGLVWAVLTSADAIAQRDNKLQFIQCFTGMFGSRIDDAAFSYLCCSLIMNMQKY